jgi:hypothetical protein
MEQKRLGRKEVAELCECRVEDIPSSPLFSLSRYHPPGPIGAAYIKSMGPVDAITGPGGSGKTVASIFKIIRFCVGAMPLCNDGRVKVRVLVVRNNYREMYRTTLRSWFEFFPPDFSKSIFTGGQDRPAQHILQLATVRNGREVLVDIVMDFVAIGDNTVENVLRGYEVSIVWCNEADLLHERTIPFAYSRTGRFPKLTDLPPGTIRPRMVAVDFNPPAPKHPLWVACNTGNFKVDSVASQTEQEEETVYSLHRRMINFFHQPSGLSPDAENRAGKTYEEYVGDAALMPENDARRMVHGLPGYASDGKPVYAREFQRRKHVAGGTIPVLPVRLHIGLDQGLSPAAILFQESSFGQVRVLAELVPGHGTGYARFVEMLRPILADRFRGVPIGLIGSDPAGFYGADRQGGEMSWAETVGAALGHQVLPAPSNEPAIRWEAVKILLRTDIDAMTPAILIDPSCEKLIEGFEAEYKFPKHKPGAAKTYGDDVVKNDCSHPHDALQYGSLTLRGRAGIIHESARAGRPGNVIQMPVRSQARADFNVWDV